jgi:hypothetical protein
MHNLLLRLLPLLLVGLLVTGISENVAILKAAEDEITTAEAPDSRFFGNRCCLSSSNTVSNVTAMRRAKRTVD